MGCGWWVKNIVPNKNVIQGMDLVYSQTKSGRPDINYCKNECPYTVQRRKLTVYGTKSVYGLWVVGDGYGWKEGYRWVYWGVALWRNASLFCLRKLMLREDMLFRTGSFGSCGKVRSRMPCENWVSSRDHTVPWSAAHRSGSFRYHARVISVGSVGGGIGVRGWLLVISGW